MDNQNDLQWRPQDWEHTLGHLKKAERLLFLKTWGAGAVVVSTVAAGMIWYPAEIEPPDQTVEETHMSTTVTPAEPAKLAENAATYAESTEESNSSVLVESTQIESTQIESAQIESAFVAQTADDPVAENHEAYNEESTFSGAISSNAAAESDEVVGEPLALMREELSLSDTEGRRNAGLKKLRSIGLSMLGIAEAAPDLLSAERLHANATTPTTRHIPLRISAEAIGQSLTVEIPATLSYVGPVRMEVAAGMGLTFADVGWSAWHPGDVFGEPYDLKRVESNLGFISTATCSAMYPLGYRFEIGVTAGIQYDLSRRLDVGIWNNDSGGWSVLESQGEWGLVTEYEPLKWQGGLRLDWDVAPEWKAVIQAGRSTQSVAQMEQVGIASEGLSPWWFKLGIQR